MIRLAVIQSTSFCNINCKYCYLPERNNRAVIDLDLLSIIFDRIASSPLYSGDVEFLWHCGEPLSAGLDFYESALNRQRSSFRNRGTFSNTIQTNGTLLTSDWCEFFAENKFSIGVSIDGPAFIHDAQRKSRNGSGTFYSVMKGINWLRNYGIRFGCLGVLTDISIRYPKELCDFFSDNAFSWVGFNVEEIESANRETSLLGKASQYRRFLDEFIDRWDETGRKFVFREISDLLRVMYDIRSGSTSKEGHREPDETVPLRIISFNRAGDFSTFSPELLSSDGGTKYTNFYLGNIMTDNIELSLLDKRDFVADILAGIQVCETRCNYYAVCGGGFISNRWAENSSFGSLETTACKLHRKVLTDAVLDWFERRP